MPLYDGCLDASMGPSMSIDGVMARREPTLSLPLFASMGPSMSIDGVLVAAHLVLRALGASMGPSMSIDGVATSTQ